MRRAVLLSILLARAGICADTDTLPSWLDTIPPFVRVEPALRVHREAFVVTLRSNEDATLWIGLDSRDNMQQYRNPVAVMNEGATVVYFYGEDNVGNKSRLDSVRYFIDSRPPALWVRPEPGRYGSAVTLRLGCDEPCSFYRHLDSAGSDEVRMADTFVVDRSFEGYISARDNAGNRATSGHLAYIVDTTTLSVFAEPPAGLYNRPVDVIFKATPGSDIYYSFDPAATTDLFTQCARPVRLPYGLTVLRFYARNKMGQESVLKKASFVVDTVAPKIRAKLASGPTVDTLLLSTREPSQIRYALDEKTAIDKALLYTKPIVIPRAGRAFVKALARDSAGNVSDPLRWEQKYDLTAPTVKPSLRSGTYRSILSLSFETSEPARVFYTLDGQAPTEDSPMYSTAVKISREGVTKVRFFALDEAGNRSTEDSLVLKLDLVAPKVSTRIDGSVGENKYRVTLSTGEGAQIHYEIGDKEPTTASANYERSIELRSGEVLRYFAIDSVGNRSETYVMDELRKPVVSVSPEGGVYNTPVRIQFESNMPATVFYRVLPDSVFVAFRDSLVLREEGLHTLEYRSESAGGMRSLVKRTEYLLDWTPPRVDIGLRKGTNDSIIVFLEGSENITVYYSLDGTNPLYSATTRIAANKFFLSRDRLVLQRTPDSKLAFVAEDLAGNQSSLNVLDFNKPSVIPNIPAGPDIVHDRVLSISLNTYDEKSQIYFERHGKPASTQSPIFTEPITLLASDTLCVFVVDASGFHGDPDTFVYIIDLPPSPQFTHSPDTGDVGRKISFDASRTVDQESPLGTLVFEWDFDGDGTFDARREGKPHVSHMYTEAGRFPVRLRVLDRRGRSAEITRDMLVRGYCPEEMLFVAREGGRSFCIDAYEWPGRKGHQPEQRVSWVRARMHCYDRGMRLCTAEQWEYACSGGIDRAYPYGSEYQPERCPTEGKRAHPSASFKQCGEGFGLYDMVGNLWEWVADKDGTVAAMAGGSYRDGRAARCGTRAEGDIVKRSAAVGFRCCK